MKQEQRDILLQNVTDGHARGWSFTPLRGKVPVRKGWQTAPRETLQEALGWAREGNVGLRTGPSSGGLLVIDLDTGKPDYDAERVKALKLPSTVTAITGSGGYHLYFQLPAGLALGNSAGKLAPAVDTKGEGGQVVFAGSIHPDTKRLYRWMEGRAPGEIAIAPLPDNVKDLLFRQDTGSGNPNSETRNPKQTTNDKEEKTTKQDKRQKEADKVRKYARTALASEMSSLANQTPGGRGAALNASAFSLGQLIGGGLLTQEEVINGLLAACHSNGLIGKDGEKDVLYHINHSIEAGKKEPRRPNSNNPQSAIGNPQSEDIHDPPPGQAIPLGQVDPDSGRLVLSTRKTLPTAEAFVREFHTHADGRTIQGYGGQLLVWKDNRYQAIEDAALRHRLQPWLHRALQYFFSRSGGEWKLKDFDSNPATVEAALSTLRGYIHLGQGQDVPFWCPPPKGEAARKEFAHDPREILPCRSMSLHIPTGAVLAATPRMFNYNALEFDYDPKAPTPAKWLSFLNDLWGEDRQAIELLQEWCGYLLTADTSQQKMLLLVGPKRSGKGTIGRVVTELIGRGNVCGPTAESLADTFGLQQLIGKSMALIADARFHGANIQPVIEKLLCVSGEDLVTVRRMYLDHVTMKIPVRFMLLSNEIPRLHDIAGALASRFLLLTLRNSFYGKEDTKLTERLLEELPGILLWALQGWERLHARGFFVQPASSEEALQMLADLASPISAFIREQCVVGKECAVQLQALYMAYRTWATNDGQERLPSRSGFGRMLAAACPGVRVRRNHETGRFYEGIGLTAEALSILAQRPAMGETE